MVRFIVACTLALGLAVSSPAQADEPDSDISEVARQLNNPVGTVWNLVVQNNFSLNKGDISDSQRGKWVTTLQPVLPIPLTEKWNWINRPVIPIVDAPIPQLDGSFDRETGLGDIAYMGLLTPAQPKGFLWGVGPTLLFPSATPDDLGTEKWSAGPAAVGLALNKQFMLGVLAQQWFSYAGDDDRDDVNLLNLQYFFWWFLPNQWQVGMGSPVIVADFEADGGDVWTVPVGVGIGKTFKIGKMPFQVSLEASYAVVHPDTFGQRWNFRLQLKPVIPAMVTKPIFSR